MVLVHPEYSDEKKMKILKFILLSLSVFFLVWSSVIGEDPLPERVACPYVRRNKGFACADVISRYDCRYYVDCGENQICCRNHCSYQCYDTILKEFVVPKDIRV
ncbi:hypothetical protein Avbf_11491 [Armadillidium vulgare]|nr:hypothetical protein Avbf_11491 [Armadillidium vulgare]